MSHIPTVPLAFPPLPLGWTQHLGPGGQLYYHNAQTQESTYVRPPPQISPPAAPATQTKEEKAQLKTPIPGTDWLRVTTTSGNVFYFNQITKQSSWTIPQEILEAVRAFDTKAKELLRSQSSAQAPNSSQKRRIREADEGSKRKRDEVQAIDEVIIPKKAKLDNKDDGEGTEQEESDDDEDEEEEWQQEAAEQLAREAEEETRRRKEEDEREKKENEEAERQAQEAKRSSQQINMPEKVNLSLEEGKALFKTLLREKDINPLLPWDTCLPMFISDPRYVLLPSVSARREAFDEYCRERARELRDSALKKKEKAKVNPGEEFDRLLKEQVKSTRTSWTEFKRTWKKDRRFYGWGRDDREREKIFREFIKQLGEKKRAAAQKAEADFFALLREQKGIKPGDAWKDVKKTLYNDPRYDAVGSSSLREELYTTFLKTVNLGHDDTTAEHRTDANTPPPPVERESKESRRERALREREERVKADQERVSLNIEKSRMGMNQEEGERMFKTMLVDAIRDPQTTWDATVEQLKIDSRFTNSPLPHNHQVKLFHSHIAHLRSKHLAALHGLLEEHTQSLDSRFVDLPVDTVVSSPPASKLGYDVNKLEDEFHRWQKERYADARRAFVEMLNENSFVEFWGRLSKMKDVKLDQGLQVTSEDIGEDEEPVNKLNMKALAETVDIDEMVKVLKRDKRYTVFDYAAEEREQWVREYLSKLSAPKLTVHVGA